MNVLIIDPDPVGAGALDAALMRRGWPIRVDVCADAEAAKTWLAARHPAVVIMELNLPEGSGMEFLIGLRQQNPGLPVVLWTDYALLGDLNRLKRTLRPLLLYSRSADLKVLTSALKRYLAPKAESHIRRLDPRDVLDLLTRSRKTCRVRMSSLAGYGDLFFVNGELVHAELMGLNGEAAYREMIGMPNPELEVYPDRGARLRSIQRSPTEIGEPSNTVAELAPSELPELPQ